MDTGLIGHLTPGLTETLPSVSESKTTGSFQRYINQAGFVYRFRPLSGAAVQTLLSSLR
jgi:hypothetical protein